MNDIPRKDQGSSLNAVEPSIHRVRLIARREVALRTMALYFERPAGFSFNAGQFIDLTLLAPPRRTPKATPEPLLSPVHRRRSNFWL